jgi:thiol:disulfide interchange protein
MNGVANRFSPAGGDVDPIFPAYVQLSALALRVARTAARSELLLHGIIHGMANSRLGRRNFLLAAAIVLACASPAAAQMFPDFGENFSTLGNRGNEVSVKAEFTHATADRPALLFVTATIQDGFHISAMDQKRAADGGGPQVTKIELAANAPVKLLGSFRPLEAPKSHIDTKGWKGLELREHEGSITWVAPVELAPGVDAATASIEGVFESQACKSYCVDVNLPFTAKAGPGTPLSDALLASLTTPGAAAGSPLVAATTTATPGEGTAAAGGALWSYIAYGVLGGLILNLMPCVLPVLGLKLLSFAKQGGESRREIFTLNLAYVAGLMAVFMVLATLAALAKLGLSNQSFGWGELYTLTWFKVAMTALVFAMALAFLGVWEIPIPGFASSGKATELSTQEGPAGAFFMGIVTTLLATPCSGPFLYTVFGYTITQPAIVTYIIFGSVGIGMSLPYLLVGAFPSLVAWLPKPGAWMDTLKQLLGFVLLATVVYLFSTINSDYFIPTLALMVALWFGCWIVGRVPLWAEFVDKRRAWMQGIASAALLGGTAFYFLSPSEAALPWQPYSQEALAAARAEGKTVLVDFTADWCLTCKLNLSTAINREDVRQLVEKNGVVPMIADWTDKNPTIKQALAELNSVSIPLMAIYPADPNAEVIVLPDLLTQGKVIAALEKAGPSRSIEGVQGRTMTATRTTAMAGSER